MRCFDLRLAQRVSERPKWERDERLCLETIGFVKTDWPDAILAKPLR